MSHSPGTPARILRKKILTSELYASDTSQNLALCTEQICPVLEAAASIA